MLRVGITGGLGSGKSTVAAMFAARGAHVVSSDEVARSLMKPGEAVYSQIVERFGPQVVLPDGTLDRKKLAQLAFSEGRVHELEAVVHPAVLAWQTDWFHKLSEIDPNGIAMVESALIFESHFTTVASKRFDRIILVIAADTVRQKRFVQRALKLDPSADPEKLAVDAQQRIKLQIPDEEKRSLADFVLVNDGTLADVEKEVELIWKALETEARLHASK